jgi:hypothetical protein
MSRNTVCSAVEIAEFVKRMAEQQRRQADASEAVRRARESIRERQQFVPKQIPPTQSVRIGF